MDPYRVLRLDPGESDPRIIKRAYNRLLREHRPERDPVGFQKIREAYEAIMTPIWKKKDMAGIGTQIPQEKKQPIPNISLPKEIEKKREPFRSERSKPEKKPFRNEESKPEKKPFRNEGSKPEKKKVLASRPSSKKCENRSFYESERVESQHFLNMIDKWWKAQNFSQLTCFARQWVARVDKCEHSFSVELTLKLAYYLALVEPKLAEKLLEKGFSADPGNLQSPWLDPIEYQLLMAREIGHWPLQNRCYLSRVFIEGTWIREGQLAASTQRYLVSHPYPSVLWGYLEERIPKLAKRVKRKNRQQIKRREILQAKQSNRKLLIFLVVLGIIVAIFDSDDSDRKRLQDSRHEFLLQQKRRQRQIKIKRANKIRKKREKSSRKSRKMIQRADGVWVDPEAKKSLQELSQYVWTIDKELDRLKEKREKRIDSKKNMKIKKSGKDKNLDGGDNGKDDRH